MAIKKTYMLGIVIIDLILFSLSSVFKFYFIQKKNLFIFTVFR
jgi:hypothetical protein